MAAAPAAAVSSRTTCVSMKGIKYLYKYVFKGPDRAMASVVPDDVASNASAREIDEISLYQDFRSIGACESCWRTFYLIKYVSKETQSRGAIHLHGLFLFFADAMGGTGKTYASCLPPHPRARL